jgi:hypothetical protein
MKLVNPIPRRVNARPDNTWFAFRMTANTAWRRASIPPARRK